MYNVLIFYSIDKLCMYGVRLIRYRCVMLNLFNPPFNNGSRTKIVLPLFDYLIKQTKHETTKVFDYYQDNFNVVESNTRLVKFLLEIQSLMDLKPETLVSVIRNNAPRYCSAYNLSSPYMNSKIQTLGEFYNRNNPEIIINVEYPFNVKRCVENYKNVKPFRVVSHEFSDFSYGIANGRYLSHEAGLCIFTLDLALLALQYQQWYHLERFVKERNLYLPTTHFVVKYVLSNMLTTHMDTVIFNRLINQLSDRPNATPKQNNSIMLVDYGQRFDDAFEQLIDRMKRQPTDWEQRLHSIPSLDYGSYYHSVTFPDCAPTRQVRWALVLSKLKLIEFLILTDRFDNNPAVNLFERDTIARELRVMRNDRTFELFIPTLTRNRIETIYQQVNRQQTD